MTLSGVPPAPAGSPGLRDPHQPSRVVLLAAGDADSVAALLAQAAPALAAALALELAPPLAVDDPPATLAALGPPVADAVAAPLLLPLPVDPGRTLADGSCWAEALGAWRQPALLLVAAEQQNSGLAAAMTALLRQLDVPLVGLVQWGDPWEAGLRRREGLPWLGALPGEEQALALAPAWRHACAQLRARGWQPSPAA